MDSAELQLEKSIIRWVIATLDYHIARKVKFLDGQLHSTTRNKHNSRGHYSTWLFIIIVLQQELSYGIVGKNIVCHQDFQGYNIVTSL